MDNAQPEVDNATPEAPKAGAVRLVLTPEGVANFARLQEDRQVASLPTINGQKAVTTRRTVPLRECYELVIRAFLERERAGESITILAAPESAARRMAWIDSEVKAELEAAARRFDVTLGALFYTATRSFFDSQPTS